MCVPLEHDIDIPKDQVRTSATDRTRRAPIIGIGRLSAVLPIIGIGRLSAVLPIIGIGRLVRWCRPIVVFALCGLHVSEIKFIYASMYVIC